MFSTTTEPSIPVILKREPVVLIKPKCLSDTQQTQDITEIEKEQSSSQKKHKLTALKRKIMEFSTKHPSSDNEETQNSLYTHDTTITSHSTIMNSVILLDDIYVTETQVGVVLLILIYRVF